MIVVLSVAITLGLGLVLTRRAVEDATLKDLSHQAALIVGEERNALSPLTHLPELQPYLQRQHERYLLDAAVLSRGARDDLAAGRVATGSVTIDGTDYYFAAEPVGSRAFILLRPKNFTDTRWTPFVEAIVIAALVGGALAAAAAWFLARRITRPVVAGRRRRESPRRRPRTGPGSRGRRGRAGHARGRLQRPLRAARPRPGGGALVPALGQPRAEDAADRDRGLRRGPARGGGLAGRRGRDDRFRGGAARPARRRPARPGPDEHDRVQRASDRDRPRRGGGGRRPAVRAAGRRLRRVAQSRRGRPGAGDGGRGPRPPGRLEPGRERAAADAAPAARCASSPRPGCLQVEDTGPGLEPGDCEQAFERFYLHSRYGRERPVGTGLGLALVKELTQAMGGTVEVSSVPGRLTVFTVRLGLPVATPVHA